jgi:hypothetical protein
MESLVTSLLTPENLFFGFLCMLQIRGIRAYDALEKRVTINEYKISQLEK